MPTSPAANPRRNTMTRTLRLSSALALLAMLVPALAAEDVKTGVHGVATVTYLPGVKDAKVPDPVPLLGVDGHAVAVLEEGDGAAHPRLRGDVADDQAVRAAGEAAVGDEADALAQPLAGQRRCHG